MAKLTALALSAQKQTVTSSLKTAPETCRLGVIDYSSSSDKSLYIFFALLCLFLLSSCSTSECVEGDCENGYVSYTFSDGTTYVGDFKNGLPDGQGTLTYSDGSKYVGEYKGGLENGQGALTLSNGVKLVGEFKDGKLNGQGTYYSPGGKKFVGEFKDGVPVE